MAGTALAANHGGVKASGGYITLVGVLLALSVPSCGGESSATGTTAASTSPPTATGESTTSASGAPAGDSAPAQLQGTWKLVSGNALEKGLLFVISERHYRVPTHLAHGDLAVNGTEIAFFNAAICGLTLPEGVGRYRWTVDGDTLHFELIGEEPCGGRADILDGATYKRIS
jgi:hypothetical protein